MYIKEMQGSDKGDCFKGEMDSKGSRLSGKDDSPAVVALMRKDSEKVPCNIFVQALYCNWLDVT